MSRASRLELLRDLKDHLGRIERPQSNRREIFSTGVPALDELLPRKGLAWGTLVEWLSESEGSGAMVLTLAIIADVLGESGSLVVIDGRQEFYPPAAVGLGIPLERLVLVRPENDRDALWAWEQALRSGAVAVVLGWIDRLNDRAFRRLQLAAETGDSLAFLLRPASCRAEPSWAEARFLATGMLARRTSADLVAEFARIPILHPLHPRNSGDFRYERCLHVELLYARGGAGGAAIELEMSDEAGSVSVVSRLADSASAPREARA